MNKTNIIILLVATLAVSSDVFAMKRKRDFQHDELQEPKRKKIRTGLTKQEQSELDKLEAKKVETGLSVQEQNDLDWLKEMIDEAEEQAAAEYGQETAKVLALQEQLSSISDMIDTLGNLGDLLAISGDLDMALSMVETINNILDGMTDIDFLNELDFDPLTTSKEADLKLYIAHKIVEIREKAEGLVIILNQNMRLMISDVSQKTDQVAIQKFHDAINKILVKLGCHAIDVKIDMNTDDDLAIAQAEHDEYRKHEADRAAKDAALARQLHQQTNGYQAPVVQLGHDDQDDQYDKDLNTALALSMQDGQQASAPEKENEERCIIS